MNCLCQHEKFSSQLQLSHKKPLVAESSKPEAKPSEAASACEGAAAKPPEAPRGEDKMTGESAQGLLSLSSVFDCRNCHSS